MLNFMNKLSKIFGVLAFAAGILALVLVIVSQMDLSSVFGKGKQYVPGAYIPDGYVSTFLGYKFTAPEGCELFDIEGRAKQSNVDVKGLTRVEIEKKLREQEVVLDLFAIMPSSVNVGVSVSINNRVTEKDVAAATEEFIGTLKNSGLNASSDYKIVDFLGRSCGVYTCDMYVDGIKAIQEGYVFAEDGYAWLMAFTYAEGMEADKEKLRNAFEKYEIEER